MTLRVAINGFGRIGEMILRNTLRDAEAGEAAAEVVAINDIEPLDQLAYLLRFDSVHRDRTPGHTIESSLGQLRVGGRVIRVFQEREPEKLPWADLGVDVVVECTGVFRTREGLGKHVTAGANRVLLTAPAKDASDVDVTLCMGVNDSDYDPAAHTLVSNASCTTNCLAPVARALDETFGIEWGVMSTIHAYTGSQALIDQAHKKRRRGRAAALNIVPTSTGAAKALGLVLPHLDGLIDGMAYRVPVPDGSVVDLVAHTREPLDTPTLHAVLAAAADDPTFRGVLGVTDEPIVSSDILGTPWSALIDLGMTKAVSARAAKIVAWYDNEWAYARRVVDMLGVMAEAE